MCQSHQTRRMLFLCFSYADGLDEPNVKKDVRQYIMPMKQL